MVRRRAAGKQRGGEDGAEHVTALDLGDQEPGAVERMGHVHPPKAERHHRDRRMGDAGEGLESVAALQPEVDLVGPMGRGGVDHAVVELGRLVGGADGPPLGAAPDLGNRCLESDLGVEAAGQRVGQLLQTTREGDLVPRHRRRSRLAGPGQLPECLHHRAVAALQTVQPGEGVPERELLRITGEGARDERVGDVVHHFLIEPAAEEAGDAFLHRRVARLLQRLPEDRQLGAVREQPRRQQLRRRDGQRAPAAPCGRCTVAAPPGRR